MHETNRSDVGTLSKHITMFEKYKKPGALPSRMFPNSPDEYTWEDWEEETQKAYPIQWFFRESIPDWWRGIYNRLRNMYWAIAHRTTHRYHVLNISNPGGGITYNVGWIDTDTQLLAVCGKLITNFMENEKPFGHIDTSEEPWAGYAREWAALYVWWTVERPLSIREYDAAMDRWHDKRMAEGPEAAKLLFDKLNATELAIDERDTEMMTRLIKTRKTMWT